MNKKRAGFTLLELMVAMGILAILIGLSIVGIQTVQRSLRNTQRGDAMSAVQLRITQVKSDSGNYPARNATTGISVNSNEIRLGSETLYELDGALQSGTTTDRSQTAYCYIVESNNVAFRLGYLIEGGNPNVANDWKQFGDSTTPCRSANL